MTSERHTNNKNNKNNNIYVPKTGASSRSKRHFAALKKKTKKIIENLAIGASYAIRH